MRPLPPPPISDEWRPRRRARPLKKYGVRFFYNSFWRSQLLGSGYKEGSWTHWYESPDDRSKGIANAYRDRILKVTRHELMKR
jgi:hypothetical protein